ncbi:hypothetical protein [Mycobacteroides salmoniphilum]|nr:hypothetical protein [Mycobacteroides salmoniphilum]
MSLSELTAAVVNASMDEYDEIGGDAFRSKYGFGPAKDFFVIRNGRRTTPKQSQAQPMDIYHSLQLLI